MQKESAKSPFLDRVREVIRTRISPAAHRGAAL